MVLRHVLLQRRFWLIYKVICEFSYIVQQNSTIVSLGIQLLYPRWLKTKTCLVCRQLHAHFFHFFCLSWQWKGSSGKVLRPINIFRAPLFHLIGSVPASYVRQFLVWKLGGVLRVAISPRPFVYDRLLLMGPGWEFTLQFLKTVVCARLWWRWEIKLKDGLKPWSLGTASAKPLVYYWERKMSQLSFFFNLILLIKNFIWNVIDLQCCCVSFSYMAKWFSTYICLCIYRYICVLSCSVMSDSLWPHKL